MVAPAAGAAGAKTKRVSVETGGGEANGPSFNASFSADGRFVAFQSPATAMVANDTNLADDVFVHNRRQRKTKRVSVRSNGVEGNEMSTDPSISANGRFVAFESDASNLVANDSNAARDIFVHDRKTKKTKRVSVRSSGVEGDNQSFRPSLSASGRYVAFGSAATNLIGKDSNDEEDIFVHDRKAKKTKRVSFRTGGAQGDRSSYEASISANGRYVMFASDATTLIANDTNNSSDVFVHDRATRKTKRLSLKAGGGEADSDSEDPSVSADGRFVAFESDAKLVSSDTTTEWDIFVRGPLR